MIQKAKTKNADFTNPRKVAIVKDWPAAKGRTVARFTVKDTVAGEVCHRRTEASQKARKTPAAASVWIVDGSDGKTYILGLESRVRGQLWRGWIMAGSMRDLQRNQRISIE